MAVPNRSSVASICRNSPFSSSWLTFIELSRCEMSPSCGQQRLQLAEGVDLLLECLDPPARRCQLRLQRRERGPHDAAQDAPRGRAGTAAPTRRHRGVGDRRRLRRGHGGTGEPARRGVGERGRKRHDDSRSPDERSEAGVHRATAGASSGVCSSSRSAGTRSSPVGSSSSRRHRSSTARCRSKCVS